MEESGGVTAPHPSEAEPFATTESTTVQAGDRSALDSAPAEPATSSGARARATRTTRTTRTGGRAPKLDATCAAAVERAREAAVEMGGEDVGEHLRCDAEAERVVTHYFACVSPGYRGWNWAVTIARASRQRQVTVDEVVLLPGSEAVTPPAWVPWQDRIRPGDVGVGDLLPVHPDDVRLVPGYTGEGDPAPAVDAEAVREVVDELGLGRNRVLSPEGRDDAAARWYAGDAGPDDPIAQAAPGNCATCGFLVRMAGPLSNVFGVCANAYAPRDGQVVALDFGCGAHSEAAPASEPRGQAEALEPVLDTVSFDRH